MVYINEFLPNPVGSDAEGEWIELWNSDSDAVNLGGWRIETKGGKSFSLSGKSISPGGHLLLRRKETKLTLHNQDGELALYGAGGGIVDKSGFLGTAPEGKSWSRAGDGVFIFAEPTPGKMNVLKGATEVVRNDYPLGASLNASFGAAGFLTAMIGAAAVLAGLILFAAKENEEISKLFFGKD